ncbi:MAG: hypothetical protein V1890_06830 [Candidatus Zixiibacteriota bacterium]
MQERSNLVLILVHLTKKSIYSNSLLMSFLSIQGRKRRRAMVIDIFYKSLYKIMLAERMKLHFILPAIFPLSASLI